MQIPLELTELWELFGTLCEEIALDLQTLATRLEQNPHIWNWVGIWLGLFWICLRCARKVIDANERRIYQAAEARLGALIHDGGGAPTDLTALDEPPAETEAETELDPVPEPVAAIPPPVGPKRKRRAKPKRKARRKR